MSEENLERARQGYEAINEGYRTGDMAARMAEFVDPECVLVSPGVVLPERGEWRGYEGLLRFTTAQMEAFSEMWVQPQEFIDAGERIVVPIKLGGRARHSGIEVEFSTVHVWTLRDGKAVRLEIFPERGQALKVVGLVG